MNYIATFYTHASALLSNRSLKGKGISTKLAPVPRALSSSCGTCVMYSSDDPRLSDMDRDVEAVYSVSETGYQLIMKNE